MKVTGLLLADTTTMSIDGIGTTDVTRIASGASIEITTIATMMTATVIGGSDRAVPAPFLLLSTYTPPDRVFSGGHKPSPFTPSVTVLD